jgi:hypothetical protein
MTRPSSRREARSRLGCNPLSRRVRFAAESRASFGPPGRRGFAAAPETAAGAVSGRTFTPPNRCAPRDFSSLSPAEGSLLNEMILIYVPSIRKCQKTGADRSGSLRSIGRPASLRPNAGLDGCRPGGSGANGVKRAAMNAIYLDISNPPLNSEPGRVERFRDRRAAINDRRNCFPSSGWHS